MKKTDKIITNNLNDQIAQLFSTLKMPAANQTFQNQQKSPDYVDMPFSVRLHHILRAEVTAREEKRKSRLYPESYILVTRFPRSWRNISRQHGITS